MADTEATVTTASGLASHFTNVGAIYDCSTGGTTANLFTGSLASLSKFSG